MPLDSLDSLDTLDGPDAAGVTPPPPTLAIGYPTGDDLRTFLRACGVVPPFDPATDQQDPMEALNPDGKVAAAVKTFESNTDWRPFLSDGSTQTRTFDPAALALTRAPGGGAALELPAGLLSASSVVTGVVGGAGGTARTANVDYRFLPLDAPLDGRPYTMLQFGSAGYFMRDGGYGFGGLGGYGGYGDGAGYGMLFFGQAGQITVTGVWGRTLSLDDDDREAILQYAAFLCYPQVALMVSRGLYGARDLNFEVRYAAGSEGSLSREAKAWKATFDAQVANRRRVGVV